MVWYEKIPIAAYILAPFLYVFYEVHVILAASIFYGLIWIYFKTFNQERDIRSQIELERLLKSQKDNCEICN